METFLDIVKKNPNSIVEIFVSSSSIDNHTITLNNGIIVSSNGEDEWEDFLDNENIFPNLEVLIDRDIEGISINLTDSKKLKKANMSYDSVIKNSKFLQKTKLEIEYVDSSDILEVKKLFPGSKVIFDDDYGTIKVTP